MLRLTTSCLAPFPVRGRARNSSEGLAKVLYKKKVVTHKTSDSRPDVVGTLLNAPQSEFYSAALKMTKLHELDRDALIRLLQKLRTFRRLDKSEVAVRAYRDGGRPLSPHHFSLLMAHANDAKQWVIALKYWKEASVENKLRPITHAAYLQTMKVAGRWREAVAHFNVMVQDKIPVEPYALHSLMNTTRSQAPWTLSLQVFSEAVSSGVKPNGVVYLVLLRALSQSLHPHRWHYALSILQGLEGKEERNAGMFNATMDTLRSCYRWQQATILYHTMLKESVVPSKETFRVLMDVRRGNAAHCVRSLAEAHKHGSPATSEMYYSVFRALLSTEGGNGLQHTLALAETESKRSTADPANPNYQTTPISLALLDILLDHADAVNVDTLLKKFPQEIETVVPQATRGLCIVGQSSQRWISEGGRVAIVDHNALMSPRFEGLQAHYDHVMIPSSSIRALVRKAEGLLAGSHAGAKNHWLLSRLRTLIFDESSNTEHGLAEGKKHRWLHALPVVHELMAHRRMSPRSLGDSEPLIGEGDLKLLRLSAGDTAAQLLLADDIDTNDADSGSAFTIRGGAPADPAIESAVAPVHVKGGGAVARVAPPPVAEREPRFSVHSNWLTSQEKVISVALMIKSLNPDTDVHVVTRSHRLLEEVRRWNAHTTTHHGSRATVLTAVSMVSSGELMAKAPVQAEGVFTATDSQQPQRRRRSSGQGNSPLPQAALDEEAMLS